MLKRGFNGFLGTFTRLHEFRSLILYSTSVASSKYGIADYLVKSVGFSEDEAVSIASKSSLQIIQKRQLVVDSLKSSGFDENHIRKVLNCAPELLLYNFEKTLEPKIRVLQELGLSGSNLGLFLSQYPYLLNRSLKDHIVPSLEMLKSLIGSNEQLVSLLLKTKSQLFLSSNLLKNLPHNFALLQSYGVPRVKIKQLMLQRPLLLMQRTQWFEEKVKSVEEKLGIPPTSAMFVHGVSALSSTSEDKLESLLQVFHSYGWSETEIFKLIRRHPFAMSMSVKLLRVKLKYFMEDLGYGSDYLATHPVLLDLSMEKRILPRTAVIQALKDKQLLKNNECYYTIMGKAESMFVEKYVLPFKDKLPQLYEYYTQQTSSDGFLSKT